MSNYSGSIPLEQISPVSYRIPIHGKMKVPGILYLSESLLHAALSDSTATQVINVACLPGIVRHSLAMPDAHQGYGAPIGGVAAFDQTGLIVPGFVGYDINCGVRLLRTTLSADEITPKLREITTLLFSAVPSGVGSSGSLRLKKKELATLLREGARWPVNQGFGEESDLIFCEDNGAMKDADPDTLGPRALELGAQQLGTLGSGNHFLEIQRISSLFDNNAAKILGLFEGQTVIMLHTGSRGLGYQTCDNYLARCVKKAKKEKRELPDFQLAGAPMDSYDAKQYYRAMAAAANFAWANRQLITHRIREVFAHIFGSGSPESRLQTVYDVSHNIGRFEFHDVQGKQTRLFLHRKGATRAFPPGHKDLPEAYRTIGQPVFIPGTMGSASYVLLGTEKALSRTWGSTCHGAGRKMSRKESIRQTKGRNLFEDFSKKGIFLMAKSARGVAEEVPEAYKDVNEVVDIVEKAELSKRVCVMKPMAVIKG
ncbi:MAG: RtcB family protein [Candidatus Ratteibacteria bacterium]|jgi:tRNA-splicing ligase RtcB